MRGYRGIKRKRLILYCVLLGVVVGAMLCLRTCESRSVYGPTREGGSKGDTIDIALLYAPMSYYMYDDTLGGYCYDALRRAGTLSGTPIRLWPVVSIDEAIQKLEKGDFDVVAPISVDNALRKQFDYTNPIYLDRQVLIQRRGDDGMLQATSSLDLAGDTLHLAKGSPVIYRLHNLMKEIGDTIFTVSHNNLSDEYLVMKVADGQIRYAVVADRVAARMKETYPQIDFSTPISFTQFQGGIIRRGDTITSKKVDKMLELLDGSGEGKSLKQRYGLLSQ